MLELNKPPSEVDTHAVAVMKVGTDTLPYIWEIVKPIIESAEDYYENYFTLGDLLRAVMNGNMDLWTFADNARGIFAVVLTEVIRFPIGPVVRFSLLGGEDHKSVVKYMGIIEQWAAAGGAVRLQVSGRGAWARILKESGYVQECIVLEKPLRKSDEELEQ